MEAAVKTEAEAVAGLTAELAGARGKIAALEQEAVERQAAAQGGGGQKEKIEELEGALVVANSRSAVCIVCVVCVCVCVCVCERERERERELACTILGLVTLMLSACVHLRPPPLAGSTLKL